MSSNSNIFWFWFWLLMNLKNYERIVFEKIYALYFPLHVIMNVIPPSTEIEFTNIFELISFSIFCVYGLNHFSFAVIFFSWIIHWCNKFWNLNTFNFLHAEQSYHKELSIDWINFKLFSLYICNVCQALSFCKIHCFLKCFIRNEFISAIDKFLLLISFCYW